MKRFMMLLVMACLLASFIGCGDVDNAFLEDGASSSEPEIIVVSSLTPAESAPSGRGTAPAVDIDPDAWPYWYEIPSERYVPLTPELYDAKGRDSAGFAYFTGQVLAAEVEADYYSTLYCHVTAEDEAGNAYALLLDYTHHPYDFEVGGEYLFFVNLAAARGVLIDYAQQAAPA